MTCWGEVRNETRGERLLARVRLCASFACRLRGLTFQRALGPEQGLLLVGKRASRVESAIHMLFVFFPIAALWLDQEGVVVHAALARPFRLFYAPGRPARDILEGPPALLSRISVGDRLRFVPPPAADEVGPAPDYDVARRELP